MESPTTLAVVLALIPWIAFGVFLAAFVRLPRKLPPPGVPGKGWPRVTVVVPARNEARNIRACLESIVASDYPDFEVIVVDDRSDDGTRALALEVDRGHARSLTVLAGQPLPEGWFGKPWACHQANDEAKGDVILFTDADTWHGPDLLMRSVTALLNSGADAVTVAGRQRMESFWERVVQPQAFMMLLMSYPNSRDGFPRKRWRRAIANGQYILFRRGVYEAIGGHEAVRAEVAEDLRLAQILTREGYDLQLRETKDAFATRMYQSLGEIVEGWSKNVATGARQMATPGLGSLLLAGGVAFALGIWVLPPAVLVAGLLVNLPGGVLVWAAAATVLSLGYWTLASHYLRVRKWYVPLYPLGGLVFAYIILRSWLRGSRRIEWKGRRYSIESDTAVSSN